eukprot:TRINITY_DN2770_c1_g1_i1.p1 TRINITY_DN2770_c1_g1~~TRINITY_DN2770_c1_g1_i1.p1  ORF type:complete len:1457 (-),score=413.47 TRINITY_DN2770_c1_g1_i1:187-4083(-)
MPADLTGRALDIHAGERQYREFQWLLLEYHPQTLVSFLDSLPSPTPWAVVSSFGTNLCDAIAHLAYHNVVHFDTNPENVAVADSGQYVTLTDFGSAVRFDSTWTRAQAMPELGNTMQLAPEVQQQRNISLQQSSITCDKQPSWELGCLLYELCTRKHPYPDYPASCAEFTREQFPLHPPLYPREFCELVFALLQPDPTKRPSLAEAVRLCETITKEWDKRLPFQCAVVDAKSGNYFANTMKALLHLEFTNLEEAHHSVFTALEYYPHFPPALLVAAAIHQHAPHLTNDATRLNEKLTFALGQMSTSTGPGADVGAGLVLQCLAFFQGTLNLGNVSEGFIWGLWMEHVEKDPAKAVEYYRVAAENSHPAAMRNLALCLLEGRGVEKDPQRAVELLEDAAQLHHTHAMFDLGFCHQGGVGTPKDEKKALHLFRLAADQGDPEAMFWLGVFFQKMGHKSDQQHAVEQFNRAAALGNLDATCSLGYCYSTGTGVARDDAHAVELYQRAADHNHARAICSLGALYEKGKGVRRDVSKAVELYTCAAGMDHARAIYQLACCYQHGTGVEKDLVRAAELYERAAKMRDTEAIWKLGSCYWTGSGVAKDVDRAVALFEQAAEMGHAEALYFLGLCYEQGAGPIEQDLVKAVDTFRRAAASGSADARARLAGNACAVGANPVVKKEGVGSSVAAQAAAQVQAQTQAQAQAHAHVEAQTAAQAQAAAVECTGSEIEQLVSKANSLRAMGRFRDAAACYEDVVRLRPDHAEALCGLAAAQQALGRYIEALRSYNDALRVQPGSADALCGKGDTMRALGSDDHALQCYDDSLSLQPGHPAALCAKGRALAALRQHREALRCYDEVLRTRPNDPAALCGKGDALFAMGSHRPALLCYEALRCYDEVLRTRPNDPAALCGKGDALFAMGSHRPALLCYEAALAVRPGDSDALAHRAGLLHALGRDNDALQCYQDALTAYHEALRLRPGHPDLLCGEGCVLHSLGRHQEALARARQAREAAPNHRAAAALERDVRAALQQQQSSAPPSPNSPTAVDAAEAEPDAPPSYNAMQQLRLRLQLHLQQQQQQQQQQQHKQQQQQQQKQKQQQPSPPTVAVVSRPLAVPASVPRPVPLLEDEGGMSVDEAGFGDESPVDESPDVASAASSPSPSPASGSLVPSRRQRKREPSAHRLILQPGVILQRAIYHRHKVPLAQFLPCAADNKHFTQEDLWRLCRGGDVRCPVCGNGGDGMVMVGWAFVTSIQAGRRRVVVQKPASGYHEVVYVQRLHEDPLFWGKLQKRRECSCDWLVFNTVS